jgi:hypothetical protein
MNKKEFPSVSGGVVQKYTIVTRCVHPIHKDKFKPDHDMLLYFSTKESAEFYKSRLIHWDEHVVGGEVFHHTSDITISFRGNNI